VGLPLLDQGLGSVVWKQGSQEGRDLKRKDGRCPLKPREKGKREHH